MRSAADRRGAALLLVLVVVLVVTFAAALAYRGAIAVRRQGDTALAVWRAREAAAAGLATALAGAPTPTGLLPGNASWQISVESTATGDRLFRSTGRAAPPFPAVAETMALTDSTGRVVRGWMAVRR